MGSTEGGGVPCKMWRVGGRVAEERGTSGGGPSVSGSLARGGLPWHGWACLITLCHTRLQASCTPLPVLAASNMVGRPDAMLACSIPHPPPPPPFPAAKKVGRPDAIMMDGTWLLHWKKLWLWGVMEAALTWLTIYLATATFVPEPYDPTIANCRDQAWDCHFPSERGGWLWGGGPVGWGGVRQHVRAWGASADVAQGWLWWHRTEGCWLLALSACP